MENEKKVVKLDDEQVEQVAGGIFESYADCAGYRILEIVKAEESELFFVDSLRNVYYSQCPTYRKNFNHESICPKCPVFNEWRKEYGI